MPLFLWLQLWISCWLSCDCSTSFCRWFLTRKWLLPVCLVNLYRCLSSNSFVIWKHGSKGDDTWCVSWTEANCTFSLAIISSSIAKYISSTKRRIKKKKILVGFGNVVGLWSFSWERQISDMVTGFKLILNDFALVNVALPCCMQRAVKWIGTDGCDLRYLLGLFSVFFQTDRNKTGKELV